jgi:hypothetical protein
MRPHVLRAVAFGSAAASRDARRDRDMETVWCGEFERLQALIGKDGGRACDEPSSWET